MPVAGYQYIMDSANHVAHRVNFQTRLVPFRQVPNLQQPAAWTAPDGTTVTNEDLGERTVSGVTAAGQKRTEIEPPGSFQGNDKPIVAVSERWIDPQTGIVVLRKQSGSNGASSTSMPDYKAAEPDPALFLVPPDYRIVDETGKFTFDVPR